jgi:hypothetical protein
MGAAMRYVRVAGRRLAGSASARVNRCRVTATHDVPILTAKAHCHTCASGRSRSVIKSEIAPAHKPADLCGYVTLRVEQLKRGYQVDMALRSLW